MARPRVRRGVQMKLSVTCEGALDDLDERESYLTELRGQIMDVEGELIGEIKGVRIEVGAWYDDDQPCNLWDQANEDSGDLADLAALAVDPESGRLTQWLEEGAKLETWGDVLLINTVRLHARNRGSDIGLHAVWRFIRLCGGGCSVVLCKPFPIDRMDHTVGEIVTGAAKIRAHWMRLGFQIIEHERAFLFLDLGKEQPSPPFILPPRPAHSGVRSVRSPFPKKVEWN